MFINMEKSITKNYIYNTLFQILSIVLPIVTTPYISRILGANGVGINSYSLSIVTYFILFANLGISSYGTREIAINRDSVKKYSKTFLELIYLKLITGSISLLAYIIFIIVNKNNSVIYIILGLNLIANIFDINWFYQGIEKYKFISIRNIIIKILFTISVFIFVKNPKHLSLYVALNSISLIISTLILWIKIPKLIIKINFKKLNIKKHIRNTLIYFLPQIATTIYTVLDKTMLGLISNLPEENGYYDQAYKIISLSLTFITSLNVVIMPRMSYLYKNNKKDEMKFRLEKSLKFVFLFSMPIAFGLIAITPDFVGWFFGKGYEKVNILLPLFSPLIIIIGISNCLGSQILTPVGKRLQSAIALWIGAILNLICNAILIPKFQSFGAVIGSLIAEMVISILYLYLSKNYLKGINIIKEIFKYLVFSIIMFITITIVSRWLKCNFISTFLEVLIGMLTYFILLLLSKDGIIFDYLKRIKK